MQKASKASVYYEPEATGKDQCRFCVHYRKKYGNARGSTCAIVLGWINPGGWCEEFSRASADR